MLRSIGRFVNLQQQNDGRLLVTSTSSHLVNNTNQRGLLIKDCKFSSGNGGNTASSAGVLKSKSYILPTLKLSKNHPFEETLSNLVQKIQLAPLFYKNAALVIDINEYPDIEANQFDHLFHVLSRNGLFPIGVSCNTPSVSPQIQSILTKCNLPILPTSKIYTTTTNNTSTSTTSNANTTSNTNNIQQQQQSTQQSYSSTSLNQPPQQPQEKQSPLIIHQSVRSGQQIYAQNRDLIIIGNVHSGGEVVSDSNIFIFGSLKGRALAGLSGDTSSKIIVNKFNAELISIGNVYHACETIPREVSQDSTTTISLKDDKLLFSSSSVTDIGTLL